MKSLQSEESRSLHSSKPLQPQKILNVRCKGVQTQVEPNIAKRLKQVARKTIKLATKVEDPKTFEKKTIEGKILINTPHKVWVQTQRKQPRLLRNSGFSFVPNPLLYGPCRPSRLSDN